MMGITPGGVYQTPSSANVFKSASALPSIRLRQIHTPCSAGKSSQNSAAGKKGAHLEKLFAPPEHLMFHGPFALAKEQGKLANKWVLVNLQDDGNFDCHIMNRDVWKNEGVAAVVEHHFLLWQQTHSYGDGQSAMHMYHLEKDMLPAVLVVDPITGAEMKRITGLVKPTDMLQWLLAFVRGQPAPDAARAKADEEARLATLKRGRDDSASRVAASVAAHAKQSRGTGADAAVKSAYTYTGGDDSDEYEYISDSDGGADGGAGEFDGGASQDTVHASPARSLAAKVGGTDSPVVEAAAAVTVASTAAALLQPMVVQSVSAEPPAGEGVTRLQLRLPQGKRMVRRFAANEPVSVLYAVAGALLGRAHIVSGCYALHRVAQGEATAAEVGLPASTPSAIAQEALRAAAAEGDIASGHPSPTFDIYTTYPAASLQQQGFKTLAEAKLLNSAVVVEVL